MSRYERTLYPGCVLAFGWDRPLASFFAQVIEEPPDPALMDESHPDYGDTDDLVLLSLGCELRREGDRFVEVSIREVSELVSQLAKAGYELTAEEQAQLAADKEEQGMVRTEFQKFMMSMFDTSANIERQPRDDD